jgi:hypothetical protein
VAPIDLQDRAQGLVRLAIQTSIDDPEDRHPAPRSFADSQRATDRTESLVLRSPLAPLIGADRRMSIARVIKLRGAGRALNTADA